MSVSVSLCCFRTVLVPLYGIALLGLFNGAMSGVAVGHIKALVLSRLIAVLFAL